MTKFYLLFHKTALQIAVEKRNYEMIRLLLSREDLDVNLESISNQSLFISFYLIYSNIIFSHFFQSNRFYYKF